MKNQKQEEKWNQQMQKQQHTVINQKCENNCPKPLVSCIVYKKLRGVHVNSRVLIAHGCSCVFFIFFGCHPFSLLSGFPCPKRKIKVIYREVRARFLGIKWHTCWFGWWFSLMHCYLAAKPVPWWPDGNPRVLGQLGLDGYLFIFNINLGPENPKSLANPGFECFFLKSSWTLASNRFINKSGQDWKVFHL
jgi:hypothetical protein